MKAITNLHCSKRVFGNTRLFWQGNVRFYFQAISPIYVVIFITCYFPPRQDEIDYTFDTFDYPAKKGNTLSFNINSLGRLYLYPVNFLYKGVGERP